MKQVLTGFLTAVLILAAALVPAYGADAGAFPGGKLEVVVRADYRDTAAALERHALTLTLAGDKTGSQQFALRGSEGQETFSCGQNTARLVLSHPFMPGAGSCSAGDFICCILFFSSS